MPEFPGRTSTKLDEIHQGGVRATNDASLKLEIDVDAVVLVTHRISCDSLYKELKSNTKLLKEEGITGFYRIGDCVAPRSFADVIFDGHRLAKEIDSANPAFPLPVRTDGKHLLPALMN